MQEESMGKFWLNKKVLVTGAAGFTGSHICEELVRQGAQVTALIRKETNLVNLSSCLNKLFIKKVDLTNQNKGKKAISGESIIIHAAAIDGGRDFKRRFAERIFHDNILMTSNLLEAARGKKVEKFVYISSAEVYAGVSNTRKIKETDFQIFPPTKPEHLYIWSKIIGEYACQFSGLKIIIVRPANIYGPKDSPEKKRLAPMIVEAIKSGISKIELKGNGRQRRSFLYVEDYVKNLLELIANVDQGIFNLASEHVTSVKDFVAIFEKISGLKVTFADEKTTKTSRSSNSFVLDMTKIKKAIPHWHDSPYKKRVKELIEEARS